MCFTAARARSPSSNASCSASSASSSIAFKRSAGDAPLRKSATPASISPLSALALALAAWLFVSYSRANPLASRRLYARKVSSSCAARKSSFPMSGWHANSSLPTETSNRYASSSFAPPPSDDATAAAPSNPAR